MELIFKSEPRELDAAAEILKGFTAVEGATELKRLENEKTSLVHAENNENRKVATSFFDKTAELLKPLAPLVQALIAKKGGLINKEAQRQLFRQWIEEEESDIIADAVAEKFIAALNERAKAEQQNPEEEDDGDGSDDTEDTDDETGQDPEGDIPPSSDGE